MNKFRDETNDHRSKGSFKVDQQPTGKDRKNDFVFDVRKRVFFKQAIRNSRKAIAQ